MQRVFLFSDCFKAAALHACSAAAIVPAVGAGLLLQHLTNKEGVSIFFCGTTVAIARLCGRSLAITHALAGGVAIYELWMTSSPLLNIVIVAVGLLVLAWGVSAGVTDRTPPCFGRRDYSGITKARNTGHYDVDCQIGDLGGRRVVNDMIRAGCPELLVYAVRDIIRKGRYTGIEIGFLMHVAVALLSADVRSNQHADNREVQALIRAG